MSRKDQLVDEAVFCTADSLSDMYITRYFIDQQLTDTLALLHPSKNRVYCQHIVGLHF